MKINAANAQETKDYMFMLPFGMEMMYDVAQAPLTIKEITNIFLVHSIKRIILVSNTMIRDSNVFGTEANKLMNQLTTEYPGFTFKVVNM